MGHCISLSLYLTIGLGKKQKTIGLEWFDVVHIIYLLLVGWRPEVVVVASLGEVQQKKMQSQRFLSLQVLRAPSSPYMAPGYDHYLAVSLSCSSCFSSSPHPSPSAFPEELQTLLFWRTIPFLEHFPQIQFWIYLCKAKPIKVLNSHKKIQIQDQVFIKHCCRRKNSNF